MTKRSRFYQIGFFTLAIAFIGLCLFVGITAVQKQMRLEVSFNATPSIYVEVKLAKITDGVTGTFEPIFNNSGTSTLGTGITLTGNKLTITENFTTANSIGASFKLQITNLMSENGLKASFSGIGAAADTEYVVMKEYSTSNTDDTKTITVSGNSASSIFEITFSEYNEYTVTVTPSSGNFTFSDTTNKIAVSDEDYTANVKANTGYNLTISITNDGGTTTLKQNTDYTWNSSTGALKIFSTAITGNITITCTNNNAITYQIAYNSNGGSGTMSNSSHTYGIPKNLTSCTFTAPTNKKFAGWAETSSGAVKYTDGQSVSNLSTTQDEVVTLYAVWEDAGYTITYISNGNGAQATGVPTGPVTEATITLSSSATGYSSSVPTITGSCTSSFDVVTGTLTLTNITSNISITSKGMPWTYGKYSDLPDTDKMTSRYCTTDWQQTKFAYNSVWKGYSYIKFANDANTRWIIIGAGGDIASSLFNASEINESISKDSLVAGEPLFRVEGTQDSYTYNSKDMLAPAANPNGDLTNSQILLLREVVLESTQVYDTNAYARWTTADGATKASLNTFLNTTFYNTGLSTYVEYIENPTLKTAWSDDSDCIVYTPSENDNSRIFLMGSRYGYYSSSQTYLTGTAWTSHQAKYKAQNFCIEDYIGTYVEGVHDSNPRMFYHHSPNTSYDYFSFWWLRSGHYTNNYHAYGIRGYGNVSGSDVPSYDYGVRPSFILNLA